jgi:hypothetical protein
MGEREDDRVIREMLAPNLDDALDALGFWLRRHSRLPFYRRAARREAERSIAFWRDRAIADASRSPGALLCSGRAVVRVMRLTVTYHARRFLARMTVLVVMAIAVGVAAVMLVGR